MEQRWYVVSANATCLGTYFNPIMEKVQLDTKLYTVTAVVQRRLGGEGTVGMDSVNLQHWHLYFEEEISDL